jgi:hypothetical protein
MTRFARRTALPAVIALTLAACGGGGDAAAPATSTTATAAVTSTTAPVDDALGVTGQILASAFTDEGFTADEGDCIARSLSDHYGGESALFGLMAADEPPADFEVAVEAATLACVSAERLVAMSGETTTSAPPGPPPVYGSASCQDPAGDLASEYSGWPPSVPVGSGDFASLDLRVDGDTMTVTLGTHSPAVPAGGPGPTPLILRMFLAANDPNTPVAYNVELLNSTDAAVPGSIVTVHAVDPATQTATSTEQYDVALTGPSLYTATLPLDAFGDSARSDFVVEIRSEWGPDHPIGSTADLEWIVDSVCDGPVLVEVSAGGGEAAAPGTVGPKALSDLIDPVPLTEAGFAGGLPSGWYEQVWFKPAPTEGQLSLGTDGLVLTGLEGNSRGGAMIDLGVDVSGFPHLVAALDGVVYDQTLSGTGWNGREAPLALVISYVDAAGETHTGLGEDPAAPGQMFYAGFVYLPPGDDGSVMTNGVQVGRGAPFSFEHDLMTLDPPPVTILSVAVDGGGWSSRSAEVYRVRLVGGS